MPQATLVGLSFAISGNFLISFGLNLQKTSRYLRSVKWWLGFTLMTCGEIANFIAYGFMPVVMVSSLGIVTLVSNVVILPIFFNQKLRLRDVIGTFLASVGVVLVILSLNNSQLILNPLQFCHDVLYSINFIAYFLVSITVSTFLMRKSDKSLIEHLAVVAIYGSYTVIATKLLSLLLENSITVIYSSIYPVLLLVVIVLTSYLQILFLNRALKLNSSTVVIPLHYIFFNLTVILSSIIVFKDFQNSNLLNLVFFVSGVLLTFLGVISICGNEKTPNGLESVPEINVIPNSETESIASDNESPDNTERSRLVAQSTAGILQRAKSTSHLLLEPIRSFGNRRFSTASDDIVGSYGSIIVGSGLLVNTFFNYTGATTGLSQVEVDTNSHR